MVATGLVNVIVTTNFDRLMEAALDEVQVRWSRVTTAGELATAQPRGVAPAFLLKLHGDYGSVDMRNTTDEIATLDAGIEAEFRAILETHGLVTIGYAGTDPAIAEVLRTTHPRLGLYWAVREVATTGQADILVAVDGFAIVTNDADTLMRDLDRRIAVLRSSPTSQVPLDVYRTGVTLIRRNDLIGLREEIKEQGAACVVWFDQWCDRVSAADLDWSFRPGGGLADWQPRIDRFVEELGPAIEALLAIGLALVEYHREDLPVLLQWLDRIRGLAASPRAGIPLAIQGACSDVANAAVLQMMAGALDLQAWPSLETLMRWPDALGTTPTLGLTPYFHHYYSFETLATWLPHTHRQLLDKSDVWKEATRDRTEPLNYVIWAGVLLAIQGEALAIDSTAPAIWTFNWNHYERKIETLALAIGRDEGLATALAAASNDTVAGYRAAFADRYANAAQKVRSQTFFGGTPLPPELLRAALGNPEVGIGEPG